MGGWMAASGTLDAIAGLGPDWNGYGAGPFDARLVDKVRWIVAALPAEPAVFPTARDSIQLEYDKPDGSYLEFEVYMDRTDCLHVPGREYGKAVQGTFVTDEAGKIRSVVGAFLSGRGISP